MLIPQGSLRCFVAPSRSNSSPSIARHEARNTPYGRASAYRARRFAQGNDTEALRDALAMPYDEPMPLCSLRSQSRSCRNAIASLAIALMLAFSSTACRAREQSSTREAAPASSSPVAPAVASVVVPPVGPDVRAMLGGVSVGSTVEEFGVKEIGGVRSDGAVPVRLEHEGKTVWLALTLVPEDDDPRPPASTAKYAVYYESGERGKGASEEDCHRVAQAMAEKLRAVEDRVPVPAGMRVPRKIGQPA